jgi:hypothetical protein
VKKGLCFTLVFFISLASTACYAVAESECSKDFKWYYAKYLKNKAQNYAVATFKGEPLKANTVCAFAGERSKVLSERKALSVCNGGLKKYGRTGKCKVIMSR